MAAADSASAAGAVSAMREAQRAMLQHSIRIAMALLLSAWWMGALNYALFCSVSFDATDTTNRVLLAGSRLTMALLDVALLGKFGSALLPTWSVRDFGSLGRGIGVLAVAMGLADERSEADC